MHLFQIGTLGVQIELKYRVLIRQEDVQFWIRAHSSIPIDVSIILSSHKLRRVCLERHPVEYKLRLAILHNHLTCIFGVDCDDIGAVQACWLQVGSASYGQIGKLLLAVDILLVEFIIE